MRWLVGLVLGAMLGGALVFGIGVALPEFIEISQREGAYAMGIAFFWTPAGMVLGGILGLLLALRGRGGGKKGA